LLTIKVGVAEKSATKLIGGTFALYRTPFFGQGVNVESILFSFNDCLANGVHDRETKRHRTKFLWNGLQKTPDPFFDPLITVKRGEARFISLSK